jgi:predicted transcriptional regulator
MNSRIKQYILIAILAAAGYFIMDNHFIIDGSEVHLLKKTSLHLHYTFYSIKQKKPAVIMKIDYLREAGIGDLLVDLGIIDQEEKSRLESEYY